MRVTINGHDEIIRVSSLTDLLQKRGWQKNSLVVELNGEILPQARWEQTELQEGDRLELLNFVGGG
jgi:sulfur carrier protein